MKSVFNKLVFLCVALAGWIIYDRWDNIVSRVQQTVDKVTTSVKSPQDDKPVTTTVYKWKDADGNWQFSNSKPESVNNAEIQQFRSDANVLPAVKATTSKPSEKPSSSSDGEKPADRNDKITSHIPGAGLIESAKSTIENAAKLKKTIETPKSIPKE